MVRQGSVIWEPRRKRLIEVALVTERSNSGNEVIIAVLLYDSVANFQRLIRI